MKDIKHLLDSLDEDINAVTDWSEEIYQSQFAQYFSTQRDLCARLQNKTIPVTDAELECVLTQVPLNLFTVSEQLSNLKLKQEIVKLKCKEIESDIMKDSTGQYSQMSDTKRRDEVTYATLEHKLASTVMNSLCLRVESEISFSKELVMSAKKIWDRRRETEAAGAIGTKDVTSNLPEYSIPGNNYIK